MPRTGPRRQYVGARMSEAQIAGIDQAAELEEVDRSEIIRRAVDDYLKAAGIAVLAVLALLMLSGCGSSAPHQRPPAPTASNTAITDAEASAILQSQVDAQASAEATTEDAAIRAAKGECVSMTLASPAGAALKQAFQDWGLIQDPAAQAAEAPAVLAQVPDDSMGCEEGDRLTFQTLRDTLSSVITQ